MNDFEDQQMMYPKLLVNHIEDDTLCRLDVDPIVVEISIVRHDVTYTCVLFFYSNDLCCTDPTLT